MKLIIIGASGHGKVVANIAKLKGYDDIVFLDNDPTVKDCAGYKVIGPDDLLEKIEGDVFIAIGRAAIRKKLMDRERKRVFPVLIHPNAVVASGVDIGEGTAIMAGAVINPGARLGRGVIVNTCASVDHDCLLSDFVHISVGSHLGDTVEIGEGAWIGAGATVCNKVNICAGCMIGAGGVVFKSLDEPGTYVGVPVKKIKDS